MVKKVKKKNAEKLFMGFHGKRPRKVFDVELGDLSVLTYLGDIVAIEYLAQKTNEYENDEEPEIYRHEFETSGMVLTNGKTILIHGPKIKVIDRGIIN